MTDYDEFATVTKRLAIQDPDWDTARNAASASGAPMNGCNCSCDWGSSVFTFQRGFGRWDLTSVPSGIIVSEAYIDVWLWRVVEDAGDEALVVLGDGGNNVYPSNPAVITDYALANYDLVNPCGQADAPLTIDQYTTITLDADGYAQIEAAAGGEAAFAFMNRYDVLDIEDTDKHIYQFQGIDWDNWPRLRFKYTEAPSPLDINDGDMFIQKVNTGRLTIRKVDSKAMNITKISDKEMTV